MKLSKNIFKDKSLYNLYALALLYELSYLVANKNKHMKKAYTTINDHQMLI